MTAQSFIIRALISGSVVVSLISAVTLSILIPSTVEDSSLKIGKASDASEILVKPRDLQLVCPGGLYRAGGMGGVTLGDFAQVGVAQYVSQFNSNGALRLETGSGVFTAVTNEGLLDRNENASGEGGQGSSLLNASQFQSIRGTTLQGLAATNCQLPSNDIWLVGGDTTTGREALLILRNTSAVDSTVSLEIFSGAGQIDAPGLSGISVVAGKATVIPLAGIIPKTKTFVTHVTASGGAVAGWIQQRTVRGLSAGGVDYVSPAPNFSEELVIPGIFIRGAAEANKLVAKNLDFADLLPVLRVFVPGTSDATVTVQIFGSNSKTFGTVIRETITGGTVSDLEIRGLADGDYVAVVSADVAIQSSFRFSRIVASALIDFTWISAAEKFNGNRRLSIPSVGISKICIYNGDTGVIDVRTVAPGSTYEFDSGNSKIYANLIVDVGGGVANLSVLDQKNVGGSLGINVR